MLRSCYREGCCECGIDEAGRGALAGPVVAAAVIWDPTVDHPLVRDIKDSKKLSAKKRSELATFIKQYAVAWATSFVTNETIDECNILQATYQAMHECVHKLIESHKIEHIIVDGNRFRVFEGIPHTCVVKGDNSYISIAAASILAKVARDEFMVSISKQPTTEVYKWDKNMGYGTAVHIAAIHEHGLSCHHRRTFNIPKVYKE